MTDAPTTHLSSLLEVLDASDDYRLLRRVPEEPLVQPDDGSPSMSVAVVDVETTGLDPDADLIVELAIRRIRITVDGRLVGLGERRSWLEDPGRPLAAEVARLTGLTDADLEGRCIDDRTAASVLRTSDLIVAHNAGFDRPFVERRLPQAAGGAWACTCNDLDWVALGFEGRSLSHLMFQLGMFFDGHRATSDVAALIAMLVHRLHDGRAVFEVLLDVARRETVRVDAVDAPFEAAKVLRARGYRWNQHERRWRREIGEDALEAEGEWLAREVYGSGGAPAYSRLTWRERHA